ncbi:putative serine/threonine-protein kinase mkcA [Balamuthia mandrillaris]
MSGISRDGKALLLHELVKSNSKKDVVRQLSSGALDVNARDQFQQTALHVAAVEGNLPLLKTLLKAKPELDPLDTNHRTPLHCACSHMHSKVIEYLLKQGANPSLPTKSGATALHFICSSGVAPDRAPKLVKMMLESKDFNIDAQDNLGQTPLHKAVKADCVEMVSLLLSHNANPNTTDKTGVSPLHSAMHTGRKDLVLLLLQSNADIDAEGIADIVNNHKPIKKVVKAYLEEARLFSLYDLPNDIIKRLEETRISMDLYKEHFDVLLQCLRFATSRKFKNGDHRPRDPRTDVSLSPGDLLTAGTPETLYKKYEIAGRGGFGRVYSAISLEDKRTYAIKKMPFNTEKEQRQCLVEINFLRQFDHPNIVKYFRSYEMASAREAWVIMEFMEGGTLAEAATEYEMEEKHIAYLVKEGNICVQMLKGIDYLHRNNFVHRDLKSANHPTNNMDDIVDFGLCIDLSGGPVTSMVGSPFWIPPEMILQQPHGYPADIWSLAICVLELANRTVPFDRNALKCLFNVAVGELPGFLNAAKWSQEFVDFMSRCIVREPTERATTKELLGHPFVHKTASRREMQEILRSIFIGHELRKTGLF